ncbi:hypothetical protein DB35_12910 [Streptomyces abyssalis]|uniref:Uncharacterized protein n=1 Tax=Streptomyces abyssalis TaxID=933944 RepID=A0A1E7JGY8_9ACTN|nr:hypothetical protein [Streptomyces abyssalis]OEU85712.1 hypothetical protein AN215_25065 [Streptomyces abyssalis]OEU92820.1 hypothetical protein DB35_12885 [Streptomyces abyssalis]OEU92823.1 hypothetical protein DB35_12910 [Streptomyces abyssalis]OEV31266.1 hypothetical protein AN219_06030 [Streptomyces nanshensis]
MGGPHRAGSHTAGAAALAAVLLTGGTSAGTEPTRQVSDRARADATTDGVPLWVPADQEAARSST